MRNQQSKGGRGVRQGDIKAQVIKALEDKRWDYRTAEGISKAVYVKVDLVKEILESDKRIRRSILKSKSGKKLYALRKRRSALRDFYTAFRAINAEKFGDS